MTRSKDTKQECLMTPTTTAFSFLVASRRSLGSFKDSRPPIQIVRQGHKLCGYKGYDDTMLETVKHVLNSPPIARQIGRKPAYFKTNNRANRDSDTNLIKPTQPHMRCIIEPFFCIPSCATSSRHNIFSFILQPFTLFKNPLRGMGSMDRWDSCDMIQSLMIGHNLNLLLRLKELRVLYGNKKKKRRHNSVRLKWAILTGADCL